MKTILLTWRDPTFPDEAGPLAAHVPKRPRIRKIDHDPRVESGQGVRRCKFPR